MQFYRDGYRPGDPMVLPAAGRALDRPSELPSQVDVLIVGTGPAGTVLGAQLAAFPDIDTRIIERRESPLEVGQADGVACRTVEMFEAFGLAEVLLREAYWVNEVRFWGPSETDRSRIVRTGWVEDTPAGLSEFPHVIVNQARMQQYLLQHMAVSAAKLVPDYGIEFLDLKTVEGNHPIEVTLRRSGPGVTEPFTVRAKYVVGCDGARSKVRAAIGQELHGDAANHAWGVIDVLATTDFPDWRTKNVVQSDGKGSLLMIPREGGSMVRCYVDLGNPSAGDRAAVRQTTVEKIVSVANAILHPYSLDVRSVVWSSVYEVGQRLAPRFDDLPNAETTQQPRVFIAGDACHTHSAKAGQGMNVSMQDAFNLGWKLAAVLTGQSNDSLLRSYSEERHTVAQDLIDFDRSWSALMAQPVLDPAHPERGGATEGQMKEEFARQGRYTAGIATRYRPSSLTSAGQHQDLATGFQIGTRFHSAPIIRVADARRMELGHVHRADGRWRIYAFDGSEGGSLLDLACWLMEDNNSPTRQFTPVGADLDSLFDVHAVFRAHHHDIDVTRLPEVLLPRTGRFGLQDWEKVWARDPQRDIFHDRGIDGHGAIVIVRPDQYVANILPLTARAEIAQFFSSFLHSMGRDVVDPRGDSATAAAAVTHRHVQATLTHLA